MHVIRQRIPKIGLAAQNQCRSYAFKSDLKIKWVRPEKIPCFKPEKTGDCAKSTPIDQKQFLVSYQKSEELKSAAPEVQSIFQLGNNPEYHQRHYLCEELIKKVQRHPLDYGSMEAKLAKMTATIRFYQDHMERHPRDVKVKVDLKELIDKRKKFLKYLRRWDYRRFEWILEKLDLIYKPPPPLFHWITRKESLQKLTNKYCDDLKETRLQELQKQFEFKQIPFLEDVIKKMEQARKDQIEWELKEYVTQAHINEAKSLLAKLQSEKTAAEVTTNDSSTQN